MSLSPNGHEKARKSGALRTSFVLASVLALFPLMGGSAWAQHVDLSHLPPHPRIYLRQSLLPTLRAERADGQPKATMYGEIRRRAAGYALQPVSGDNLALFNLAFVGIIDSIPDYTKKAVQELMYQARHGGWTQEMEYCIGYDWLYNYMTPAQRDTIRNYEFSIFSPGWSGQRTVYYNLEANEAISPGIAGLAFYGDGGTAVQDQRFQDMIDNCDGRMRGVREFAWPGGTASSRGGVLPTRQFYFPDGGYYKGNQYAQKDIFSLIGYLYLFEDLGLGSYWGLCQSYLDNLPEYFIRIRRPDQLTNRIMMGSNFDWETRGLVPMAVLSSRGNGLASWIMGQFSWPPGGSGGYQWYYVYLFYRPGHPQVAANTLPLYKFYGEQGHGINSTGSWHEHVITRTGWNPGTQSDDVYFDLTAGDYFGDYLNYFEPTFEIYYHGALAIRSGFYTDEPHNQFYYSNAVSCNTVAIFDSTMTRLNDRWGTDWLASTSWGGPGAPVNIYDVRDFRNKYDVAEIEAFEALPQGVGGNSAYYAKAVVNPNAAYYYSNASRKVKRVEREFFWVGQHFVIADNVKLDPSGARPKKIRWLLHMIDEPAMSSTMLYSVVPNHVAVYGLGAYTSQRVEPGYDGKITVVPLLPADAVLRKVGGSGYQCWADANWTSGTNYPPSDTTFYANEHETGRWRVETIAAGAPDSVNFLHYVFVGKPGQQAALAHALTGDGMVGCEVSGVGVIVFNRKGSGSGPLRYQITGENMAVPNVIGGLRPYTAYAVRTENGEGQTILAGEGGALYFLTDGPGEVSVAPAQLARVEGLGRSR